MSETATEAKAPKKRLSTRARVGLSVGLVIAGIVAMAGLGANATYTGSGNATGTFSGGSFSVTLGAGGTSNNRLTVGASGLVPNDTIQRAVNITNGGTVDFASVVLTTTAPASSALDTDTVNGLQMTIDSCPTAWTESGPPYTYTCSGPTNVVASRPVIGSNLDLGADARPGGATGYYRITLTVPASASVQGATSNIQYGFTAVQRVGGAR